MPRGVFPQPLFIAQRESHEVVRADLRHAYVAELCDAGKDLRCARCPDRSHGGVLEEDPPLGSDLEQWTIERFAGEAPPEGCSG